MQRLSSLLRSHSAFSSSMSSSLLCGGSLCEFFLAAWWFSLCKLFSVFLREREDCFFFTFAQFEFGTSLFCFSEQDDVVVVEDVGSEDSE